MLQRRRKLIVSHCTLYCIRAQTCYILCRGHCCNGSSITNAWQTLLQARDEHAEAARAEAIPVGRPMLCPQSRKLLAHIRGRHGAAASPRLYDAVRPCCPCSHTFRHPSLADSFPDRKCRCQNEPAVSVVLTTPLQCRWCRRWADFEHIHLYLVAPRRECAKPVGKALHVWHPQALNRSSSPLLIMAAGHEEETFMCVSGCFVCCQTALFSSACGFLPQSVMPS